MSSLLGFLITVIVSSHLKSSICLQTTVKELKKNPTPSPKSDTELLKSHVVFLCYCVYSSMCTCINTVFIVVARRVIVNSSSSIWKFIDGQEAEHFYFMCLYMLGKKRSIVIFFFCHVKINIGQTCPFFPFKLNLYFLGMLAQPSIESGKCKSHNEY